MRNLFYVLFGLLVLTSCDFSKKESQKNPEIIEFEKTKTSKDSLKVEAFEIELNLSEKAEKKLKDANETVIIQVEFVGYPEKKISENKKYEIYDENGQLTLGSKKVELKTERNVKFDNCKISKKLLELLKDKTYDVRITTFSGRKSSEDNLLDCDFLQDDIQNVKNKKLVINGKLIYGE
jgi:phosphoenolpyruvate synthase/pyruvate phosphate dikinase